MENRPYSLWPHVLVDDCLKIVLELQPSSISAQYDDKAGENPVHIYSMYVYHVYPYVQYQ